ncbi:hypothetical protein EB796_006285 [Bugula neritina]|uniref:Uncharacterized protein n=1 Tax=Bugula neritina TaxID=10212 RepID=A0A7J7KC35_BUGNE|nr:hypothetical protein EB796_006285 [Bugula neritina]
MYTSMKITFLLLAISAAALACFNHKSCETCTKSTMNVLFLKVKCQWCPLSQTCHVKGSNSTICIFILCAASQLLLPVI